MKRSVVFTEVALAAILLILAAIWLAAKLSTMLAPAALAM